MNLPNRLTISRFILTGLFLFVLLSSLPFHESLSLVLFIAASLTDYWDGRIARREKLITNFGILMDPLADKVLNCSAFIALVELGHIAAWMAAAIVAREFAITGLRLLAASKNVVLAAEKYGKHKTIWQIVAIIAILTLLSYRQWPPIGPMVFGIPVSGRPWVTWFAELAKWIAVVLTFFSGAVYLMKNRSLYLHDM